MSGRPLPSPIPVVVLTGFLGSGKTTLLQRLLTFPECSDAAILVNEFGEIGIDHHLAEYADEDLVMLANGCICCTIRDDLGKAMRDLLDRRASGTIPSFARLFIETTGLADPVPILHTLMTEPVVDNAFRLVRIVTTADAVNGETHLARQPESAKQVAVADRIVITKCDLAPSAAVSRLTERLRRLNPSAPIVTAPSPAFRPDALLGGADDTPDERATDIRAWLSEGAYDTADAASHHHHRPLDVNRHDERIAASCLVFDEPIDWAAFSVWLTMLLHGHGEDVLRVKGIVNVPGLSGPVVINGVQHIIHPPIHLERWPDDDRRSRIVFITRDMTRDDLETSLATFVRASRLAADAPDDGRERPGPVGAGMQVGGRPYRRAGGLSWMK